MSIGNTIAAYRKQKGYTQEQLGEILGVSNQAVSKWESAVSMPDIMLLPKIADALGITLNDLYEIKKEQPDRIVDFDKFPEAAQHTLIHLLREFRDTYLVEAEKNPDTGRYEHLDKRYTYGCISDKAGVSFISDNLTIIDSGYAILNNGDLFENRENASCLKKLADAHVRKVLAHLYSESFGDFAAYHEDYFEKGFLLEDISHKCGLSEEDALEAVEKLITLHIIDQSVENNTIKYVFYKTKAIEAAVILRLTERLLRDKFAFGCGPLVGHSNIY